MEPISTGSLITVILAVVGFVTTVVETSRYIIIYLLKKNKPEILSTEQKQRFVEIHAMAVKTYDIVSKTDKDSVPLCYFPRNHLEIYREMSDLQYKLIERLAEITSEQKRIADLLDRIERRLDANNLAYN